MNLSFSNKKGNAVVDGIVVLVILFVLAIVIVTLNVVNVELEPTMSEELTDATANATYQNITDRSASWQDGMFAAILALLWIGSMILAYFIDSHPVMFAFSLILLVVVFIVAGVLSNAFGEYNAEVAGEAAFPIITYVMNHLIQFIAGFVLSMLAALFAKSQMS